jgi:hypothetical protein
MALAKTYDWAANPADPQLDRLPDADRPSRITSRFDPRRFFGRQDQ